MTGRCVAAATLAVALAIAAAAALGGEWPLLDAASSLAGQAAGAALAAIAALLVRRRFAAGVLAAGIAAMLLVHAALGLRPFAIEAVASDAARALKIVHVNTWHRLGDSGRLEVYLAGTGADAVALAEIGPGKQALLQRLKRIYPHQLSCAAHWACSLAILSRHPIETGGFVMPGPGTPPLIWARIATPSGPVTVAETHIYRPSRNADLHAHQLEGLAGWVRSVEGPLILAGDFNAPQHAHAMRRFLAATGLAPAHGFLPSWPAYPLTLPQVALDHVLVSRGLEGTSAGLGPAVGSDHFPVWARIAPARARG